MRAAIIGAGLAALSCAEELVSGGHDVVLFDKGRGPGGRMSTRRIATVLGEVSFDHGAPYFTAQDRCFQKAVAAWEKKGLVCPWPAGGHDAWIGIPGMNAVIKGMAERHEVRWKTLVQGLLREGELWTVVTDAGMHGPFETVVVATPGEQAAPLLSLHDLEMARVASLARSRPCWIAAFVFGEPIQTSIRFLRDSGVIALALSNTIKPSRGAAECWVVHANSEWSKIHLEAPAPQIASALLGELFQALEHRPIAPIEALAHRWRYAFPEASRLKCLWNPSLGLGACGDWLLGPTAECAWLSGRSLARAACP